MTDVSERYAKLAGQMATRIAAVPADGWDAVTPCEGWTARDLLDHLVQTGGLEHERPELVTTVLTSELAGGDLRERREERLLVELVSLLDLLEDVVRANHGVLNVGAALAFEAQRLLEVEHDHLAARVLHQEVADGGDADHFRDSLALAVGEFGVTGRDLASRIAGERIQEVVSLDAQAFSTRDLDKRPLRLLRTRVQHVAEFARGFSTSARNSASSACGRVCTTSIPTRTWTRSSR